MERRTTTRRTVLGSALVLPLLAACGVTRGDDTGPPRLRMMIPNRPGGGYDETGRAAVKLLEDKELTSRFEVFNVTGASGTVAMARLLNEKGSEDLLMAMGLGVVGAVRTNGSDATVDRATPIARLIEDAEAVYVPADSPFRTIADMVTQWKADPSTVTVGGGSSPGGPDHLFPMEFARAVGIDAPTVNYTPYDGGGDLLSALLGAKVDIGTSGSTEFDQEVEAGKLRILAVSSAERLELVDAPTLTESGIDLEFTNWRGILAPPGISRERQEEHIDLIGRMHDTPEWQAVLKDREWTDAYITGDEFGAFLEQQDELVATTLDELGLS